MTEERKELQWPPIGHETLPWHRDSDDFELIPKSARRRILPTYEAAVPLFIRDRDVALPAALMGRIADVSAEMARFDAHQQQRGYDLPALLLRSESAASSQIEHLTSSVRNVALAEVSDDAPQNARLIAGNVVAMREALSSSDALDVEDILAVHRVLIERGGYSFGGMLRDEPVWIGGTAYSPHGALYVPPKFELVPAYLDDMVAYAARSDVNSLVKAAVLHAQFETVHPFIDGNGRTGRALLHKVLRHDSMLIHTTLPVSAGLLHNIDAYMTSISRYQEGDPVAVVEQLVDALELAMAIGTLVARDIDAVIGTWRERITERAGSGIHRLPGLLVEQPVVNTAFVARKMDITQRAASTMVSRACEYGMLRPMGNRHRGEYYQADALISVLEEVSSIQGIRRMVAGKAS